MSGIGGIWNLDGTPVDELYVARLGSALARRGPDSGPKVWHGTGISLIYRAYFATDEERFEAQPFTLGPLRVMFDGRLDNRESLILSLMGDMRGNVADVELVARAYMRWDLDYCSKLLGDFAIALWDELRGRLSLARDPFGVKTLFISKRPSCVVWGSTTDAILSSGISSHELDENYLASYLSLLPQGPETPFSQISCVEPGTMVIVEAGNTYTKTYWKIEDCAGSVRHSKDSEYEDHFLSLLGAAVRGRLRASSPVVAELSGGLDSSAIVCIAESMRRRGSVSLSALRTVSRISPSWADELEFIREIELSVNCPSDHIAEDGATVFSSDFDSDFISHPTTLSFCPRRREQIHLVRDRGARVILSGEFGDAIFRNDESVPIDLSMRLFKEQSFQSCVAEFMRWSSTERTTLFSLLSTCVKRDYGLTNEQDPLPAWLSKDLVTKLGLSRTKRSMERSRVKLANGYLTRYFSHIENARLAGAGDLTYETSEVCVEARFPYMDIPLVSFLGSIPPEQLWRPGDRRSLMRKSLAGILPERVRERQTKSTFGGILTRGIETNWKWIKPLVEKSILIERGWICRDLIMKEFESARCGLAVPCLPALLRFLSAEIWINNLSMRTSCQPQFGIPMLTFAGDNASRKS